ncbi:MAG: PAS domain-containing protein [Gammaproteobacteria bacterium]
MAIRTDAPSKLNSPEFRQRWQTGLDLLAETGSVPVVLVARYLGEAFEVMLVNQRGEDRIPVGARRVVGEGSYQDAVLHSNAPVHVFNALADARWMKAIAISGGLTSYIGYPLRWPDGTLFGTLCALDSAPNNFDGLFCRHIEQAVRAMDAELASLYEARRLEQEIAAHQATENALRLSEALHNEAQRIAKLGHWYHDLQTDRLTWSDEMFRIYEVDVSRFGTAYQDFLSLVHPEDRAALDQQFMQAVATGRDFTHEYRLQLPDGRSKWLRAHAITTYAADGTAQASLGTTQDITQQKESAQERELLANIIRHARELVNAADPQGRMLFLNGAGGDFLGIAPADATRFEIFDVIPEHLQAFVRQELLPTLLATGHWEGNLQYRNLRTGELRDFRARCFAITDPETGVISSIANVSEDITARLAFERQQRNLERQLQHADKLDSLGLMAGGIAHDFNNLLQAILGNLALADEDLPDAHPAQTAIARCVLTARRAADISRQLLTVAGQDAGITEPVDAVTAVRESIDMLRSVIDKRIRVTVTAPDDPLMVQAAPGQLQQVIVNLVINAADAMSDRPGILCVSCRERLVEQPFRDAGDIGGPLPPGVYAELEVADEGCGMDEATIAHLFDPFFTTKVHGRGLGMPAVMGIVRSAGGHFNVRSAPGAGTVIRICWPLTDGESLPVAPAAPRNHGQQDSTPPDPVLPFSGRHLLVVDDEETLRFVAAELLRRKGARVTEAASGSHAITIVESAGRPFDAAVLDITMPGLDGGETFQLLRALQPGIPVLFASGYDAPDVLVRVGETRGTAFVGKPWQPGELFEALAQLLQSAAPASG